MANIWCHVKNTSAKAIISNVPVFTVCPGGLSAMDSGIALGVQMRRTAIELHVRECSNVKHQVSAHRMKACVMLSRTAR